MVEAVVSGAAIVLAAMLSVSFPDLMGVSGLLVLSAPMLFGSLPVIGMLRFPARIVKSGIAPHLFSAPIDSATLSKAYLAFLLCSLVEIAAACVVLLLTMSKWLVIVAIAPGYAASLSIAFDLVFAPWALGFSLFWASFWCSAFGWRTLAFPTALAVFGVLVIIETVEFPGCLVDCRTLLVTLAVFALPMTGMLVQSMRYSRFRPVTIWIVVTIGVWVLFMIACFVMRLAEVPGHWLLLGLCMVSVSTGTMMFLRFRRIGLDHLRGRLFP